MENNNTTPATPATPAPPTPPTDKLFFEHGKTVITVGVIDFMSKDWGKAGYIYAILNRHLQGDFGDLTAEDIETNLEAIKTGQRIISSYEYSKDYDFYIITEADRSVTTILLKSEY